MVKNFVEELRWRGMLHNIMPGTEEQLNKEVTTAYIGFDPTAASLHIGNLATLMLLVHFQKAGHKPIVLVGGATGMVGDPSGKNTERTLLDEATLTFNQEAQTKQLARFLDFSEGPTQAEVVNNYHWFKPISFLDFLRDIGKHITVNYMMAKDSVKNRMETGISFTEFSYQLLQGYDFVYLNKTKNCKLQMGGSDQWGNITTGTELIRRMGGTDSFALTCPLITKADGSKFGKSESGNVWLDASLTSPYKFYQFWLNVTDQDASKLIRVFTFLDRETIEQLEVVHAQNPELRTLQKTLATEITTLVHGPEAYNKAVQASEILFGKANTDMLESLDEATLLEVMETVPQMELGHDVLNNEVINFLAADLGNQIFESKSEAKKLVQAGGLSINGHKVVLKPAEHVLTSSFGLLQGKYLLIKKGKKSYFLVTIKG
jgi:tyrosyl-tRNA synthetase